MAKAQFVLKGGTVLTPELDKQLADEAEAGYDLSKARRVILRPGRPAKGDPVGESPRVAVRVPSHVYEVAKRRATSEGRTLSNVLRELLAQYAAGDRVA
jgi:predicted DNA binding CopG/RHH family protein